MISASDRGGIEVPGKALDAHAAHFQFGCGFQRETGFAAQAIQFVDQQLIEAVEAGIGQDAGTSGAARQGQDAGDPLIGVDGADDELVETRR